MRLYFCRPARRTQVTQRNHKCGAATANCSRDYSIARLERAVMHGTETRLAFTVASANDAALRAIAMRTHSVQRRRRGHVTQILNLCCVIAFSAAFGTFAAGDEGYGPSISVPREMPKQTGPAPHFLI